jgi:PAS domain S-box-containing protein
MAGENRKDRERTKNVITMDRGGERKRGSRNSSGGGGKDGEVPWRRFFDASPDPAFVLNEDIIVECNQMACTVFGGAKELLLGKSLFELGPAVQPDGQESVHKGRRKIDAALSGHFQLFDWTYSRFDGTSFHSEVSLGPAGTDGKLMFVIIRDIGKQEGERFSVILENHPNGVALVTRTGIYKYLNQKFTEITGYTLIDIPSGRQWFRKAFPDPRYRRGVISTWVIDTRNREPGEKDRRIFSVACKDGVAKSLSIATVKLETGDFIINLEDVTEQRKREETLLLTQFSIDHAWDSIFWILPDSRFSYVNEASCRMLGYSFDELLSMSVCNIDPEYAEEKGKALWNDIRKHGALTFETRFHSRDGRTIPVEVTGNYVRFQGQEYVLFFARDIAGRKRTEEALYAEKERLAVTLGSIGDGVIATDTKGLITLINVIAGHLTGWPEGEAVGSPLGNVFHIINEKTREICENPVEKVLKTGTVVGLANHTVLISKDGRELAIADSGAPIRRSDGTVIGVVLVFRDMTEKRKTEEEMARLSKLESISVLAGGIAHDFNNLLSIILGNLSLARSYMGIDNEKALRKCSDAEQAVTRAKDLTQQLLTFSKGGAPMKTTSSLMELLRDSAIFALTGADTMCKFEIVEDLMPVEVDQGQISQVISNLVINADQAMSKAGTIRIRAENVTLTEEKAWHTLPLAAGAYVKISVVDQGPGIPKAHLNRIFDPYFTTKKEGSGLGLAMAHSIIKNHDGYITADSRPGKGAVFTIYLPVSSSSAKLPKKKEERTRKGSGKVLIMDDEEMIRSITAEMLESLGYETGLAADGKEALFQFTEAAGKGRPFDAVLLDLTIPGGMGGIGVMQMLREIDPGVRAVVLSGYSTDPIMSTADRHGFKGVLSKPYTMQELSETLSTMLEED